MTTEETDYKIVIDNDEVIMPDDGIYTLGRAYNLDDYYLIRIYEASILECYRVKRPEYIENVRVGTIVHEIGHWLGLSDNPDYCDYNSIMSYDREQNVIVTPQYIDVYNVLYQY